MTNMRYLEFKIIGFAINSTFRFYSNTVFSLLSLQYILNGKLVLGTISECTVSHGLSLIKCIFNKYVSHGRREVVLYTVSEPFKCMKTVEPFSERHILAVL